MTLEEMETVWSSLETPPLPQGITGRRASGMPVERATYLAVDGRGRRHLLILVPDDTEPLSQRETKGLEVTTARFIVGSNAEALYVDLVCVDQAQNPTFSAVSQDMLRALARPHGRLRDDIVSGLARWRAFWSTIAQGMSREYALGLFGELWFLRRWLSPVTAEIVGRWQATEGARHDFQWTEISVEVKATASRIPGPLHYVSGLDQLDNPERGQLLLFSLQMSEDALAANSLHSLVEGLVTESQHDFHALTSLNEKLASRGYSPADRGAPARKYRVLAERLYRVDEGFPRITRATFQPGGLPPGVVDIGYNIDLAACQQWLVATGPTDEGASFLRSSE